MREVDYSKRTGIKSNLKFRKKKKKHQGKVINFLLNFKKQSVRSSTCVGIYFESHIPE